MNRAKRAVGYLLLFLLPLFVVTLDFNFKALIPIYLPAKYFLWGIAICLMLIFTLRDSSRCATSGSALGMTLTERHPALFFLIALWIWFACSFFWSINRYQTLEDFTQWSLTIITIFLLTPLFGHQKQIRTAIFLTLLSVIIAILISFSEKYIGLFRLSPAVLVLSFSSTFANTKFIAHYSIIILPLVVYLIAISTTRLTKFFLTGLVILVFAHTYLLNVTAKSFWLGLMLDAYLLLLFAIRKKPYFRKFIMVSVSLFVMSVGFAIYHTSQRLGPERRDSTMQQRYIIWGNTLRMIADHPLLGTGLGTFSIAYPKYESPDDRKQFPVDSHEGRGWSLFTRQTHNDILQIFQETGFIGISLFLLFLFFLLKDLVRRCISEENRDNQKFLVALLLSLANLLLTAAVYFPFHEAMSSLLFSFLVSLILAKIRQNEIVREGEDVFEKPSRRPSGHGSLRRRESEAERERKFLAGKFDSVFREDFSPSLNFLFCLLLLLFFSYASLRFFLAEWHWNRANFKSPDSATLERELEKTFFWNRKDWEKLWSTGLFCTRQRDYPRAKGFYEEAHRLSPYTTKIVYNLGVTHRQLGNVDQSVYYLDKTLKIAPDYVLPYYHLAVMAYDKKKYKKAVKLFKKSQAPTNSFLDKAWCFAAICYYRLKKIELAKRELIEALSINPDQIVYHRLFRILDAETRTRNDTFESTPLLFSEAYKLLSDPNQQKRSEATSWFLTLPPKKLFPLIRLLRLADSDDLRFRLFYILSEKLPHQIVPRALSILNDKEERSAKLKVLSLRAIAKTSPQNLNRLYPFVFNENEGRREAKQTDFNNLQNFYAKVYLKK